MYPSPDINYDQLPNQYFSTELSAGKRLIIIGESSIGDLYNPIACTSETMAQTIFGTGPLIDRFHDAITGGSEGAYLMRMEPNALDIVYAVLNKFSFDLIYINSFFFDTSYDKIQDFIEFAKGKEQQGQLIHGFFDVENIKTFEDAISIYSMIGDLSISIEDGIEETGKFISVIFDQMQDHQAGAVYAGLISNLAPEVSPINKTIGVTLKQEFTNIQIKELRSNGIVCFRNTLKKGVVCTSSSTAVSTEDSPHKHIANFRIAQYFILDVAYRLDLLIGTTGMANIESDTETELEVLFAEYVMDNRIKTGSYHITLNPPNGIVYVSIELIPIFSIYKMNQSTQVRVRT